MFKNKILTLLFILLSLVLSVFSTPTQIDSCQTISTSGEYILNQSVTTTGMCFIISEDNVSLNCDNYNVTGNSATGSGFSGIYTSTTTNVTVKNCNIHNFEFGFRNSNSPGSPTNLLLFENSSIINSSHSGFEIENVKNSIFTNITIDGPQYHGFFFYDSYSSAYNEIFNNTFSKINFFNLNESIASSGFHSVNGRGSIYNNTFTDIYFENGKRMTSITNYNNQNKFENNTFSNFNIIDSEYGFYLYTSAAGINKNNVFTNIQMKNISNKQFEFLSQTVNNTIDVINLTSGEVSSESSSNLVSSVVGGLTKCGYIDWPGLPFVVGKNLTSTNSCFNMGENSTLNCKGYTITGPTSGSTYNAIYSSSSNFLISNCNFKNFEHAINYGSTGTSIGNSRFENLTFLNTYGYVIYIDGHTHGNIFKNILIENASSFGFIGRTGGYTIKDNVFSELTIKGSSGIYNNGRYNFYNNTIEHSTFLDGGTGTVLTMQASGRIIENNTINNITVNNYNTGIYFTGTTAKNNIIKNSFINTTGDAILHSTAGNNTYYGNIILGTISNNNWATYPSSWNSSNPVIGNYYSGFGACSVNETRTKDSYTFSVCTTPSNYDVSGGSSIFDNAPLASSTITYSGSGSGSSPNSNQTASTAFPNSGETSMILSLTLILSYFLWF